MSLGAGYLTLLSSRPSGALHTADWHQHQCPPWRPLVQIGGTATPTPAPWASRVVVQGPGCHETKRANVEQLCV